MSMRQIDAGWAVKNLAYQILVQGPAPFITWKMSGSIVDPDFDRWLRSCAIGGVYHRYSIIKQQFTEITFQIHPDMADQLKREFLVIQVCGRDAFSTFDGAEG
jgi:hypothetical protein